MNIKESQKRLVMGEFDYVKGTNTYDVANFMIENGKKIPLNEISFMYKERYKTFVPLATGEYRYSDTGGHDTIEITSPTIRTIAERIQVIRTFTNIASALPDNENDIAKVVAAYNKFFKAYEQDSQYLKDQVIIADGKDQARVFPELKENEVLVRTKDGYKGVPIEDVDQKIKDIITKFAHDFIGVDSQGNPLKPDQGLVKTIADYLNNIALPQATTGAKTVINEYVTNTVEPELVTKTTELKKELVDELKKLYHNKTIQVADASIYANPTMIKLRSSVGLPFIPTPTDDASDGILVPDTVNNTVTIYTQSTVITLPANPVDSKDNPLVEDEYYFHDNAIVGRPSRDKPTGLGIFQVLFKYIGNNKIILDIGVAINNTPEINNSLLASKAELIPIKTKITTLETTKAESSELTKVETEVTKNKHSLLTLQGKTTSNDAKVGDVSALTTHAKVVVPAINEVANGDYNQPKITLGGFVITIER